MKDYTKYDFSAIKDAYVEMEIAPTENPAIHATINGMVVYQDPTSILVLRKSGTVTCFLRSEIISLSAKIKVEDMSVKQLKRLLETYQDPVSEHAFVITEDGVYHSVLSALKEIGKQDFTDYIDCTDWGWKDE